MAHWCAYQMTALNLGVWKFKYLFHDITKPWLMAYARIFHRENPYKWVQQYHRSHSSHHLQHYQEWHVLSYDNDNHAVWEMGYQGGLDIEAMLIDWECSRYTKTASPWDARTYYESFCQDLAGTDLDHQIREAMDKLGL